MNARAVIEALLRSDEPSIRWKTRVHVARAVYYKWQGLHWVVASLADLGYSEGDETLHPIRDRLLYPCPSYGAIAVANQNDWTPA